ncbi:putative membrane protein [Sesbania bispinosa]|nr:putative membrane protein [Sesbania bispinosa]
MLLRLRQRQEGVVCCYGVTNGGSQRSLLVFYGGRWKILRSYLDTPCCALRCRSLSLTQSTARIRVGWDGEEEEERRKGGWVWVVSSQF